MQITAKNIVDPANWSDTLNANDQDLDRLTKVTWRSLTEVNEPPFLFLRNGAFVLVQTDTDGKLRVGRASENRVRWVLAHYLEFTGRNGAPAKPPLDLVRNLLATPNPPLPMLEGIVAVPTFNTDLSLHATPGYDPKSRMRP